MSTSSAATTKKKPAAATKKKQQIDEQPLVKSLNLLDPLLQFLTKRSGKISVPLTVLQAVLPGGQNQARNQALQQHIPELANLGILRLHHNKGTTAATTINNSNGDANSNDVTSSAVFSWDGTWEIGFPAPPLQDDDNDDNDDNNGENWIGGFKKRPRQNKKIIQEAGSLCGSTKTAAKRRLATLRRSLKAGKDKKQDTTNTTTTTSSSSSSSDSIGKTIDSICDGDTTTDLNSDNTAKRPLTKDWDFESHKDTTTNDAEPDSFEEDLCQEARQARESLQVMFHFERCPRKKDAPSKSNQPTKHIKIPEYILPKQAAYAGSNPAQTSTFGELPKEAREKIPDVILDAFGIDYSTAVDTGANENVGGKGVSKGRRLYSHQASAISSAVQGRHTLVCTSTGSGKSLCFLIPALAAAYNASIDGRGCSKGVSLIMFPTKALAQDQLTKLKTLLSKNPDLESHIIPATLDGDCPHERRSLIAKHANVILTNPDTLHAAILPQWKKIYNRIMVALQYVVIDESHVYEGIFGTHVALVLSRLHRLCMVARCDQEGPVSTPTFLSSSATLEHPNYHFRLLCPIPSSCDIHVLTAKDDGSPRAAKHFFVWNPRLLAMNGESTSSVFYPKVPKKKGNATEKSAIVQRTGPKVSRMDGMRRRHAADETALLLARAIIKNVRCIAFCKSRSVVEWVYERTVAALRSQESTKHLVEQVQPYRGGYKLSDRREIEKKLFDGALLGVVATSALELGVDIGGIELTLHVGYPSSISSLLQQAGRAGRGGATEERPSLSICVAFSSPSEQYLWKKPTCLLSRGISSPRSFPINAGVASGHILCASREFPLTGQVPATTLRASAPTSGEGGRDQHEMLSDQELFGSEETYTEALDALLKSGSVVQFHAPVVSGGQLKAFKAHAFMDKPWLRVSIRSIEALSFSIVDISHPLQGGQMNGIQNERAVLDNLPYSRVFYHCHPGAIILHRGQRYKIVSMTRPPPYDPCSAYRRNLNLAAYAKPTQDKYLTRPLSRNTITIVKQIERVDVQRLPNLDKREKPDSTATNEEPESTSTTIVESFSDVQDESDGSFAGCGVITAKRSVRGFTKLSLITRAELSRHELQLPDMEYDSFGLWIDCEAEILGLFLGDNYAAGVHALSHALLAVAPLFIPCVRSDLQCDHAVFSPTRVCLFDERAGGSGTCAELWKSLFVPNGLLEAAVDLLANCASCCHERNDLGCPACLQSGQCTNFNQDLSRSAALVIGRRMLKRLQQSEQYKDNRSSRESPINEASTPRKKARTQALRHAKDMSSAKERLFVVGRPSWPTDDDTMSSRRQELAD